MSEGRLMLVFSGIEFQSIHRKYRDCALDALLDLSEHALCTNEDDILLDKRIEGHKYSLMEISMMISYILIGENSIQIVF